MLRMTNKIHNNKSSLMYLKILWSKLSLPINNATPAYINPAIFVTEKKEAIPKGSQYSKGKENIKSNRQILLKLSKFFLLIITGV